MGCADANEPSCSVCGAFLQAGDSLMCKDCIEEEEWGDYPRCDRLKTELTEARAEVETLRLRLKNAHTWTGVGTPVEQGEV